MRTSLARTAGAAMLLALISGHSAAQVLERTGPVPIGAVWVNQLQDSGSFGSGSTEVTSEAIELEWKGQKTRGVRTPQATLILTSTGEWVGMVGQDGSQMVSWDPPLGYQWPLEVGKSWTTTHQVQLAGRPEPLTMQLQHTVEAYEDVSVPAGTFKAYRVRAVDSLHNESVAWFSPELRIFVKRTQQRTGQHPQGPGTREFQLKSHTIAQ